MSVSTSIARPRGRWLVATVFALAALFLTLPRHAAAAPLTTNCSPGCNLYAKSGTTDLPGASALPVWGFTTGATGATDPVTAPGGPTLVVTEGVQVTITLHNGLSENISLAIPQQAALPDSSGVAGGSSNTYTFTPGHPGTYLYEAGTGDHARHQVAMGLYGALVVLPSNGLGAFGSTDTAYDEEYPLVLSEIDPALNNSATPANFDMKNFTPRYWLIGGHTYGAGAGTPVLSSAPGHTLLLRYVNAGVRDHSMGLLGLHQRIVGNDGYALGIESYRAVAETVAPGQTLDTLVSIPSGTASGTQYAVFDQGQHLDNNGAGWKEVGKNGASPLTPGGMLTFITTSGTSTCVAGPVPSSPGISPASASTTTTAVTATATFTACGGKNVAAAEYFVDASGTPGTGVPVDGSPITPGNAVTVNATINPSSPANPAITPPALALTPGVHHIYLRAQDDSSVWGSVVALTFTVGGGPTTSNVAATVNGDGSVTVTATANDTTSGNDNIAAAEYFIDATGANGAGVAMTADTGFNTPVEAVTGTISATTAGGLTAGPHTVYVHSEDAANNWGGFASATFTVGDTTGPVTSAVTLFPNPNNGTLTRDINVFQEEVRAHLQDVGLRSNIVAAEGVFDNAAFAQGSGAIFLPKDGTFNSPSEDVYMDLPLSTIAALPEGTHTFYVRGKDAAGNWGAVASGTITIDKTGPTITTGPATNAISQTLTATATDAAHGTFGSPATVNSNIATAEWFIGADPGAGNGTLMQAVNAPFDNTTEQLKASLAALAPGVYTISVRAKDAAGNWGPVSTTVYVTNLIFASTFANAAGTAGSLAGWSITGGASVAANAASHLNGTDCCGMAVNLGGTASRYAQNTTPLGNTPSHPETTYHARFYFNPNGTLSQTTARNIWVPIFRGQGSGAHPVNFSVQYERNTAGAFLMRACIATCTPVATITPTVTITNAAHAVEIDWHTTTTTTASISLTVDGTAVGSGAGTLAASTNNIDQVQLGILGAPAAATTGTAYFDSFVSTRFSTIGP